MEDRPLGETPYLILDARQGKVRHAGQVRPRAVTMDVGIGHRSVLGASVSLSEAEVHRRGFPAGLQARGPQGVKPVVSDANAGLRPAPDARPMGVPRQRCQSHPMKNTVAFVPMPEKQAWVVADPRAVSDAPDRPDVSSAGSSGSGRGCWPRPPTAPGRHGSSRMRVNFS